MTTGLLPKMPETIVGPLKVNALVDGAGPAKPAAEILKDVPETLVEDNLDWLVPDYLDEPSQRIKMAVQSFVIEAPETIILVDCAVGEDATFNSRPDWHLAKSDWLNHLGQAGLRPEDIDTVFLTHLHMDHTGWLTRKHKDGWKPSFPGAKHLTTKAEYDFWTQNHESVPFMEQSIPDSVVPVAEAGLFSFVEPEDEIATNIFVTDLAGHSPGMAGLEYREAGRVIAAFSADLMHHPLQMTVPGMSTGFCSDPALAAKTRESKLAQYAKDGTVMFCGHFPGYSAGYVEQRGDGFHFVPVKYEQ